MYVGIDLAKATFTATLRPSLLDEPLFFGQTFDNSAAGFKALLESISQHVKPDACILVTENTGVYGERLYYFCYNKNLKVTMEPAHSIRRAFRLKPKTDPVDSGLIAEYGFRYPDQLHFWSPPSPVVEQVRILLVNRAQIQKTKTAMKNILKALGRKERQDFIHTHKESIQFLNTQVKLIDKAMSKALHQDMEISRHTTNLASIPGCALIFCANFLVMTEGYRSVDYRNLAGYLGISPNPFESGETVYRRPKSDKKGPNRMRKQLYLSAMSALKQNEAYQNYFQRQTAKGKPGGIIMNNLENKLLRMACAIVLSGRPYDASFKSIRKFS